MDIQSFLKLIDGVRPVGDHWMGRCPAHDDRTASLSVSPGEAGQILIHCFAGCGPNAVLSALGLSFRDIGPNKPGAKPRFQLGRRVVEAEYFYRRADRSEVYKKVRYAAKDFRTYRIDSKGRWVAGLKGVACRVLYYLPELLEADTRQQVLICEGEKDADRLHGHGIPATTNVEGGGVWREEYCVPLIGRHVVVLQDNDDVGRRRGAMIATQMAGRAKSLRIVDLPGLPPKGDVSDWLDQGHSIAELLTICEATPLWRADQGTLPVIELGPDEQRVNDEAIEALARQPQVFVRGRQIVELSVPRGPAVTVTRRSRGVVAYPISLPRLRELLSASATFVVPAGEEKRIVSVPNNCVQAVFARGSWPQLRWLESIVTTPLLLADGAVLQTPGYHEPSGIYYDPAGEFPPVKSNPTPADIEQAVSQLWDVVADFPFEQPSHRSTWLACLLTLFARRAFSGPTPLFLIEASSPGTGKGLLTSITSIIAAGRDVPRMPLSDNRDEVRKMITAVALAGERLVVLDDISAIESRHLFAAITADEWRDRTLGQSAITDALPLSTVWVATGNNIAMKRDAIRRIGHIRLKAGVENPESRGGFKHDNLLSHVLANFPGLATACLTLLRAYIAAGTPAQAAAPWGSFEGWSNLVRNCILWLGLPDPADGLTGLKDRDTDSDLLRMVIEGWREADPAGRGLCVSEAKHLASTQDLPMLRLALAELASKKGDSSHAIGNQLARFNDQILDGQVWTRMPTKSNRGVVWRVVPSDGGDTSDASDTVSPHSGEGQHRPDAETPRSTDRDVTGVTGVTSVDRSVTSSSACRHRWHHVRGDDGHLREVCSDCGKFLGYATNAQDFLL